MGGAKTDKGKGKNGQLDHWRQECNQSSVPVVSQQVTVLLAGYSNTSTT